MTQETRNTKCLLLLLRPLRSQLCRLRVFGGPPQISSTKERRTPALSVLTSGGYAKGSPQFHAATERLAVLSKATGNTDRFSAAVGEATACFMGPAGFYALEGGFGTPERVRTTDELLEKAHSQVLKFLTLLEEATLT